MPTEAQHRPPLLEVEALKKHFPVRSGLLFRQTATVHAVDGVSFSIEPGTAPWTL